MEDDLLVNRWTIFCIVKLIYKYFLEHFKNNPNRPDNIQFEIDNHIKTISLEESLYVQVVLTRSKKIVKNRKQIRNYK